MGIGVSNGDLIGASTRCRNGVGGCGSTSDDIAVFVPLVFVVGICWHPIRITSDYRCSEGDTFPEDTTAGDGARSAIAVVVCVLNQR